MKLHPRIIVFLMVLSVLINAFGMHVSLDVSDNLPQYSALKSHSSPAPEGPAGLRAKTEISLFTIRPSEVFDQPDESGNFLFTSNFYFLDLFPEKQFPENFLRPPIA